MLVSDLDGTFLEKDGTVPVNADEFFAFLSGHEIRFAVATARCVEDVLSLLPRLVGTVAVCSDGSITAMLNAGDCEILHELILPHHVVGLILSGRQNAEPPERFLFSTSRSTFTVYYQSLLVNGIAKEAFQCNLRDRRPFRRLEVSSKLEPGYDIRGISWLGRESDIQEWHHELSGLITPDMAECRCYVEARAHGLWWSDLVPLGSTKGEALGRFLRQQDQRGKIISLGNGDNDVSMFQHSAISFCPATSSSAAASAATDPLGSTCGHEFLKEVMLTLDEGALSRLGG
jgi:hydroxymethylpyrimidine pyrophosphatase-like HAD family hydrolase